MYVNVHQARCLDDLLYRSVLFAGQRVGDVTQMRSKPGCYTIFQSSLLLASKSILVQIAKILRDFLWSGGKGNQNKIHLVKWETIKRALTKGRLQIRYP